MTSVRISTRPIVASFLILVLGIAIGAILANTTTAQAQTRYVKMGGTGDGTSWATASGTLQAMINAVETAGGGTVCVSSGTYTPGTLRTDNFQMKNNVGIYGGFPNTGSPSWGDRDWQTNLTVLSGEIGNPVTINDNCYHVFYHPDGLDLNNTAILDGFTITGGNADGSSPHDYGGGMFNYSSSPALTNCTFRGNSASWGAGIYNYSSSPMLTNCTFKENLADYRGGGMYNYNNSSPALINCTFSGNSADYGGGIYNYNNSSPALTNSTFWVNSADYHGGGMFNYSSSPALTNCILWGDTPDEIHNNNAAPIVSYCDVEGGYSGECNISGTPMFVNPGSGDFHLMPISPCIDSGNNAAVAGISEDFEGDNRMIDGNAIPGAVVDMGIDEFGYMLNMSINPVNAGIVQFDTTGPYAYGTIVTLTGSPEGGCAFSEWTGDLIGNNNPGTIMMDSHKNVTANFVWAGTYMYVNGAANGDNDGTSWANAFTDLQDALGSASSGIEIWVAAGTYTPGSSRTDSFQMKNNVAIYGGFPNTGNPTWGDRNWETHRTVLSGEIGNPGTKTDNCYHVFYHPSGTYLDSTAILDGFTISEGYANGSGDHGFGGGMYNAGYNEVEYPFPYSPSPTVTNCTFSGNLASGSGGGMFNGVSSPQVTGCTFNGNSANDGYGGGMFNGGSDGSGMFNSSSPQVTNCTFSGNSAGSEGGGMCNWNSSSTVSNCTFSGNSASGYGGGMCNRSSSPQVTDCTFSGNSAGFGGGIYNLDSSPTPVPDVWIEPDTGGGAMYNNSSSPVVTNCTFSKNSADFGGGMFNDWDSSPQVTNCILWGNIASSSGNEIYNYYSSSPVVTYCDVEGEYAGAGNIDADPQWVNPGSGDFHLQSTSPCIDSGTNSAPNLPATDFEGEPRIVGGIVDMGVDEAAVNLTTSSQVGGSVTLPGEGIYSYACGTVVSIAAVADACYSFVNWSGDTSTIANPGSPNTTITMNGDYSIQADFIYSGTVIYVNASAGGNENGCTWANAFTNLQSALSVALGGDEIWVASGTYTPAELIESGTPRSAAFQMKNNVGIYGGFPNTGNPTWEQRDWEMHRTALSGEIGNPGTITDNCYHVFYHDNPPSLNGTAILDGFTITGGNADGDYPHSCGGGMFNRESSPAVNNCTFSSNNASYGGGMYNREFSSPTVNNCAFADNLATGNSTFGGGMSNFFDSSPHLSDCTFSGNRAEGDDGDGGGIYSNGGSPTLINCKFYNNHASDVAGGMFNLNDWPVVTNCTFAGNTAERGGGMFNTSNSHPVLTNCVIYGNQATSGGGVTNYSGSPTFTNCIIWGNTATLSGDNIFDQYALPNITYSDIQGGYAGGGNIDADPLWVNPGSGDFHLMPTSPCIDAGTNSAPNLPAEDFEGDPRIINDRVDMGVDEVTWVPWSCLVYDNNLNGKIEYAEMVTALMDYLTSGISYSQMIDVLMCYLTS